MCVKEAAEMCHIHKPEVTVFYEPETHTVCSVVRDPGSYKVAQLCAGLDPLVLFYSNQATMWQMQNNVKGLINSPFGRCL